METAHSVDASLSQRAQVLEMMQSLKVDGCDKLDYSVLARYYEKLA